MRIRDVELKKWAENGGLTPFDPVCINPASVDLRWSGRYRIAQEPGFAFEYRDSINSYLIEKTSNQEFYDKCLDSEVTRGIYAPGGGDDLSNEVLEGFESLPHWSDVVEVAENKIFLPNTFYLLDTLEFIKVPPEWAGLLALKSSLGRLGLEHLHAGYFDPGFSGTGTLEIRVVSPWPIVLRKGQRIIQLAFDEMNDVPEKTYALTGRYSGQTAPQPALKTEH